MVLQWTLSISINATVRHTYHPNPAPALFLLTDDLCGSREMSPPRQRKPTAAVAGTERKFSWATQRITELTHDLEKAQKQAKVCRMHALQDSRAGHHSLFQGGR